MLPKNEQAEERKRYVQSRIENLEKKMPLHFIFNVRLNISSRTFTVSVINFSFVCCSNAKFVSFKNFTQYFLLY